MKYFDGRGKLIGMSVIIGFVIAFTIRVSPVLFTADFERVYDSSAFLQQDMNKRNMGKDFFGLGGLPVSSFADCTVRMAGGEPPLIRPVCDKYSSVGELAIFFNAIFWGFLVYVVLLPLEKIGRKLSSGKE